MRLLIDQAAMARMRFKGNAVRGSYLPLNLCSLTMDGRFS